MLYLNHTDRALENIFSSSRLNQNKEKLSLSVQVDTDFSKVIHIISCYCSDVTTSIPSHENTESQSTGKPL